MKKILLSLILLVSTSVMAHGYWRHGGPSGWHWVAPAVVGGVIGYEIARPTPPVVIVQQPPPYVTPPLSVTPEVCSPWTQIRNPDGDCP